MNLENIMAKNETKVAAIDEAALVTVIEPSKGWVPLKLGELWDYRELLYFFVWRDIKIRYKQTILGAAWAVIQPFFTMVIFLRMKPLAESRACGKKYSLAYCSIEMSNQ